MLHPLIVAELARGRVEELRADGGTRSRTRRPARRSRRLRTLGGGLVRAGARLGRAF
jgi:hypothetical protein